MNFTLARYVLQFGVSIESASIRCNRSCLLFSSNSRRFTRTAIPICQVSGEEVLVAVGGGAAGVYGAIRANTVAPKLDVVVLENGKPLLKILAEHYPRGYGEFRGSFFNVYGPMDTMSWFSDHGAELKDNRRVFPVTDSSSMIIDCLLSEAKQRGVSLQTGKVVTTATATAGRKFLLKLEQHTVNLVECIEADYLLIASGSSNQGDSFATQLGDLIVDPVPSLFTFNIGDVRLTELSGAMQVTFPKVIGKLKLENVQRNIPHLTQVGPMLVTHWGPSEPVILRLSARGACDLFSSGYEGVLAVDFIPDLHIEEMKSILSQHKHWFVKQKVLNSCPSEFGLVKRFWKYILHHEGICGDALLASISNNSLISIAHVLKHCTFEVTGKISLNTMEGKLQSRLFFAGELRTYLQVLNVDGVTGGFNFQNAWSGGYIAGTSIGRLANETALKQDAYD